MFKKQNERLNTLSRDMKDIKKNQADQKIESIGDEKFTRWD